MTSQETETHCVGSYSAHKGSFKNPILVPNELININGKPETLRNFGCPKGVEKIELFSQETYHSQNFRYETLKYPPFKNSKCVPLTSFCVKVTNS